MLSFSANAYIANTFVLKMTTYTDTVTLSFVKIKTYFPSLFDILKASFQQF